MDVPEFTTQTKKPGRKAMRKDGRNVTVYLSGPEVAVLRLLGQQQGGGLGAGIRFLLSFYANNR